MKHIDQKYLLNNIEWNNLIVLDACRYDIFNRLWTRNENVFKVLSPASWTLEWLIEIFGNKKTNAIVYSATPYINSITEINIHGIHWVPKRHFDKIVDLWLKSWDPKLGTVPPSRVYLAVKLEKIKAKKFYKYNKRIIWFLQPHYPYITSLLETVIKKYVGNISYKDFFSGKMDKIIRSILLTFAKNNNELIIQMYEETLEKTLKYVYKLIKYVDGVTIITSDHGELLGEDIYLQILSSIFNLLDNSFKERTLRFILRRINIVLGGLKNNIIKNKKTLLNNKTGSSYIVGNKVYFHPPVLYSSTLRTVPFVVIK